MSKRELIARELDHMPDQDLDKLLAFLRLLKEAHAEATIAGAGRRIITGQRLAHA